MPGYVVVRTHGNNAWVQSHKVYRTYWWPRLVHVTNRSRERVVEWQGTRQATINWFNTALGGRPIRWLP